MDVTTCQGRIGGGASEHGSQHDGLRRPRTRAQRKMSARLHGCRHFAPPDAHEPELPSTVPSMTSCTAPRTVTGSPPSATDAPAPPGRRPLCYRCEHRAQSLEGWPAPRAECGTREMAVSSCYMYRPVTPVLLRRVKGDRRPVCGPWVLSARMEAVDVAPGECELLRVGRWWLMCFMPAGGRRRRDHGTPKR